MPVLDVEIIGEPETDREGLAARIAEATARVFESPPQGTWVRVRVVALRDYAENGGVAAEVKPVHVRVTKRVRPAELVREVHALTKAVARACERDPKHVHLFYEPPAAGRVAFGGRLVEGDERSDDG